MPPDGRDIDTSAAAPPAAEQAGQLAPELSARHEDPGGLVVRFEEHRPRMRAIAYRMLGSYSDADDVVQEAWLRYSRSDSDKVESLGAWLTTVVARLCLNVLRTRENRRETSWELLVPDPLVDPLDQVQPEHAVLLADAVGSALLVVLETLPPPERVAYVLHEVFAFPFEAIADVLERSPEATRKLASRARHRLRSEAPVPDAGLPAQRRVVEAFFAAARGGQFDELVAVLHSDVALRVDLGPLLPGATGTVKGAEQVARRALQFADPQRGVVAATVNGAAGVVVVDQRRPTSVMGFTVVDGRVAAIDVLADPERLARLDLSGVLAADG